MANMRVHELAKELNISSKEIIETLSNDTKKYTASNGLTIDGSLTETNLKKNSSVEGNVKVKLDATVEEGGTVTLTYCPDLQYNEYSMNWELTR